ncbi:MAG: VWA domain-containing protein [Candidatus Methanoplasma sp.]|jgi:magnesium chelatase subunit D|nr:VWA domain-containing protein [Candidatus Methanoplasma sp.]
MPPVGVTEFPFAAVRGMDDAKRAILCALANRRIRTVLIRGGPGTAKTALARAAGPLSGGSVVNIPPGASEDMIFGGIDAEATMREGRPVPQAGLLSRADGRALCIDDANLMDRRVLASILDCVARGKVSLEREGASAEYPCGSLLIATVNPCDSDLSPHLLDRFDLCAYSGWGPGEEDRMEIAKRGALHRDDPAALAELFAAEQAGVGERLEASRRILPLTVMSDGLMEVAAELSAKVSADGFRGDIAMVNASLAIAALNGRDEVLRKDVEEAARICLAHRRGYAPEPPAQQRDEQGREEDREEDREDEGDRGGRDDDGGDGGGEPERPPGSGPEGGRDDMEDIARAMEDMVFEIGEQFRVVDYLGGGPRKASKASGGKGRRDMAESSDAVGRYARSRIPDGRARDIAFDATIRAAAPHQRRRGRAGMAVSVEKSDLREKVREKRRGCTILFLVDASGSLGVRRRMAAVKGAVLSMLRDSYVKRDRVGLMAFRRDSAELVLPPTRSVEYGYRMMGELPTGGKTPLGAALVRASEYMTSYSRSHPGEACCAVLITDGRANVPLKDGADANEEAVRLAGSISVPGLRWVVVDAGAGRMRFDNAERLAMELEGAYFRLEDLNADRLAESVRSAIM